MRRRSTPAEKTGPVPVSTIAPASACPRTVVVIAWQSSMSRALTLPCASRMTAMPWWSSTLIMFSILGTSSTLSGTEAFRRGHRSRRPSRGRACLALTAQLSPLDLPARGLRKPVDEVDPSWVGVGGVAGLDPLLELVDEPVVRAHVAGGDDECFDDLTSHGVRSGDHGAFGDRGVLEQNGFDVEGADPVSGHDDHVVVAGAKAQHSGGVDAGEVAGNEVCAAGDELAAIAAIACISGKRHQRALPDDDGESARLAHLGGCVVA